MARVADAWPCGPKHYPLLRHLPPDSPLAEIFIARHGASHLLKALQGINAETEPADHSGAWRDGAKARIAESVAKAISAALRIAVACGISPTEIEAAIGTATTAKKPPA